MSYQQKYRLINKPALMNLSAMLNNLPLDGSKEVVIRDYVKPQSHLQRKLMFGVRLEEIAKQAWVNGRQYSVLTWHEYFKEEYLPEKFIEGETLEGYQKWIEMPNGTVRMAGSTTKLTTRGQINYMHQVEAYAAQELGVRFSADNFGGKD